MWVWAVCGLPTRRQCGGGHQPDDSCTRAGSRGRASRGLLCQHPSSDLHLLLCLSHSHKLKLASLGSPGQRGETHPTSEHHPPWEAEAEEVKCRFQRRILIPALPPTDCVSLEKEINLPVIFSSEKGHSNFVCLTRSSHG